MTPDVKNEIQTQVQSAIGDIQKEIRSAVNDLQGRVMKLEHDQRANILPPLAGTRIFGFGGSLSSLSAASSSSTPSLTFLNGVLVSSKVI